VVLPQDLEVKADIPWTCQTIDFKPGGSRIMFVNLEHPLNKSDRVHGTLSFEWEGVPIEYSVEAIDARRAQHFRSVPHSALGAKKSPTKRSESGGCAVGER
jgi:copper(I)-binding protein